MLSLIYFMMFSFSQDKNDLDALAICQNGNIVRTIEVSWVEEEKACVTEYTKAGKTRIVGRANNKAYCHKFIKNIQSNLEKAGWQCRDVSSNTYEFSSE